MRGRGKVGEPRRRGGEGDLAKETRTYMILLRKDIFGTFKRRGGLLLSYGHRGVHRKCIDRG